MPKKKNKNKKEAAINRWILFHLVEMDEEFLNLHKDIQKLKSKNITKNEWENIVIGEIYSALSHLVNHLQPTLKKIDSLDKLLKIEEEKEKKNKKIK